MSTSMILGLFDWIGDFFKSLFDLIPKIVYLLYASLACVLDVLQLFFRKLAGLDVYYVDGEAVAGDLVTNFITGILGINPNGFTYSALSTVFWAFIVFGIIMCFMTTIVAIVKSHYSYDEKAAKGPMQYVYTAGKAIINMAVVPIIVVLGLYLSQAILTALDTMTSVSSGNVAALYGDQADKYLVKVNTTRSQAAGSTNTKETTYIFYDIFGYESQIFYGPSGGSVDVDTKKLALIASTNQTFSGSLFKVAAYNGNRARLGTMKVANGNYTGAKNDTNGMTLFGNAKTDAELADMIDTAFGCNLHLKQGYTLNYSFAGDNGIVSFKYFTNFLTKNVAAYSKFNVGLVWYYYDLWNFNFIVGFAACIVCATIFINIIMGLITRLFMCIGLFLVAPPLFGLAPLDGGKAGKSWQENFMKQVLMAYGAVVGMNIFFLILPYMNEIDFFNIAIADYFAQTLIIIVGLITIKAFIATLSGLIGAADANETGGKISEEVGQVAGKATAMTVGAAKGVIKAPVSIVRGGMAVGNKVNQGIQSRREHKAAKREGELNKFNTKKELMNSYGGRRADTLDKATVKAEARNAGLSRREANQMWDTVSNEQNRVGATGTMNASQMKTQHAADNSSYGREAAQYTGSAGMAKYRRDLSSATSRKTAAATLKGRASERYSKNVAGIKDLAFMPFKNVDTVMDESKLYSTFKEKSGIKPKVDWAKEGAQATQGLLTETRGGRADMKQGFEDVGGRLNTGFSNTSRGMNKTRSNMNSGFANMHADVTATNAALGNIEHDTRRIKKNTGHISSEVDGLKQRTKNVLEENKTARKKQKQTAEELKSIRDNIENIDRKL